MRSETKMLDLILQTAQQDERIRVVMLNGSRANPEAASDPFQDFDIVYIVTDMAPYINNPAWIARFGEMMVMQMPDAMQDPPPSEDDGFAYLMQFPDGNRIDLGIYPLEKLSEHLSDSQSILLLDKDGIVPPFPTPSNLGYLPKPPSAKLFEDCCNEFWWVSPYVAKGLWRKQITYAKHMMEDVLRAQVMKILTWQIGVKTNFQQSPGKMGKYFQRHLDTPTWELLMQTYADADPDHTWDALFKMCELFRLVAVQIAEVYQFTYPHGDDERVSAHLRHVRALPSSAREIY
jgi:aminoglycoside 6-adenylyltransferase